MSLLVKARREGRDIVDVTPRSAGWRYVGFAAHRLAAGESMPIDAAGRRAVHRRAERHRDGRAARHAAGATSASARSVFDDRAPYAVYLPDGDRRVGHARIRRRDRRRERARAGGTARRALIEPSQMKRSARGSGANTRFVCDILPQTEPAAHLLVVEVRTPSGHSSSYPPHKHDTDNLPPESSLEETYYHRLNPAQGFAFQRVYTDDRSLDESLAVEDHDVVMVPRGYHPVVVPYGYESYYLNVMAGPTREWHFRNDPAHEWMLKR